ncbi:MAG TPA: GAF domain-containing SpoIIE family protein phosphatase [Blastocatellia bacterium]|nr:GAF domain-containing SpoIIE family protein phosphatase [Blastocatellia bacterium]
MRVFPRIHIPRIKPLLRKLRQARRHLTVRRATLIVEWLVYGAVLLFAFTGSRAAALDELGGRADLIAMIAAIALIGLIHLFVSRRIVPALERRFAPAPYDERRIIFDLGQEARAATDIDHLYNSIVARIKETLEAEDVSIFVRDDATRNYICRVSTTVGDQKGSEPAGRVSLSADAFVVKRMGRLGTPLVLDPAELEMWERALSLASRAVREARARERETLSRIKATLLVQIKIKDQLAGILSLGPRRGGHPYSASDKEMLMTVAGQLGFVIENSKLLERIVAEERLRRELALAAEVQQRFLPTSSPASSCLELSGFCQPARGVGGDYYDFLEFGNEQIGIAVADVAGKGMSAALLMSSVQASLRSQVMGYSLARQPAGAVAYLVATMNRLLCRSTGASTYVTFFYAHIDSSTRQLTYVNAGHNPPLLLRMNSSSSKDNPAVDPSAWSDGQHCLKLTSGGPVIGLFEQCSYEQETVQLRSGDLLVAYTDGVTEALNTAGEEFGEERMQQALIESAHLPAAEARDALVGSVQAWCANAPQHDDLTFIILKVR